MTTVNTPLPTPAPRVSPKPFEITSSSKAAELTLPQRMGTRMWAPMFAMALMGFAIAIILAAVRAGQVAGGDAADLETLRHLVTGFMFLGFTGVFASISFAIARILGVFRVGGGAVQHDVGSEVQSLNMPATGRAFIAMMMMGMMAVLIGALLHIVVGLSVQSAIEADLLTSERWFLFGEGLRRLGVGLYLVGITLGLVTIAKVIRFQAVRIRQLT